ncbi:MAG TPA: hypothetical protein VF721_09935 [Pyrinomonadaceae bacterium]
MLRIAFAFSCILLFASLAFGQTDENPPLKLTISLEKDTFCLNEMIKVKAEMQNVTSDKIAIDKNSIWYSHSSQYITFPKSERQIEANKKNRRGRGFGSASMRSSTSIGDDGPGYVGDYLILDANQKFEDASSFDGKLNFAETATYTFYIRYGQFGRDSFEGIKVWRGVVRSNKVTFKIVACEASIRK